MIEGGLGWSTYCPQCVLRVERRTLPGEREDDVVAELEGVVKSADPSAELRTVLVRPPSSCSPEETLVGALDRACASATGKIPERAGVGYWMDAALFTAAGIPAVAFGPTGEGAHAAAEWVDLESVATCAAVLARVARDFCR
jgi:acetylornithine deacetylase